MEVPLLLLLLFLSGFFSAAEMSFFSVGSERIASAKTKAKNRRQVVRLTRLEILKSDREKLLVTILLGNNIVNVAASATATVIATSIAQAHGLAHSYGLVVGAVTGVMTLLILIFGEIVPKSVVLRHNLGFCLLSGPILSFLQIIFLPIIYPFSRLIKKFLGEETTRQALSEDEIKAALDLSEGAGKIDSSEKRWTQKVLELNEHAVGSVMTPRSKIFAIPDDTPVHEAIQKNQEEKFSRIPVFHEEIDNVIGVLGLHGVLAKYAKEGFDDNLKVANLPLISPLKVPITMKLDALLELFREEKSHMGMVYDEHGSLTGIITLEDVLEEVFGEILDEEDSEEIPLIRQHGKSRLLIASDVELERVEEFILEKIYSQESDNSFPFPWEIGDENKTIGLFLLEKFEKFPKIHEKIILRTPQNNTSFIFTVTRAQENRIEEVDLQIMSQVERR